MPSRRRASHYMAVGGLAAGAFLWANRDAGPWRRPLSAPAIVVTSAYDEFTRTLGRNGTLSDVLQRAGIAGPESAAFLAATKGLPVRKLRPGLVFHFRRVKSESVVTRVMVRPWPDRRLWFTRRGGDSGWVRTEEAIPWSATRLRVAGVIESSLYDALDRAVADSGLPAAERRTLAWAIADVYDWEVDFTRDVRPGDCFAALVERLESPEGERRVGRILAARVEVGGVPTFAFYFAGDSTRAGFYDERGRSLRRAFLRAPLAFRRIASRFGGRYHPIVHRWRSHQGTDYAATAGTPVRATAEGVVTWRGPESGYGNMVELRHAKGIRTRYGHLSSFAKGLHPGQRVHQRETVGYVGSTGLSTGPHLHYEFLVNGHATDPRRRDMGVGTPVPLALRGAFDRTRRELLAQLLPELSTSPTVAARDD